MDFYPQILMSILCLPVLLLAGDPVPTGDIVIKSERLQFMASHSDEFDRDKVNLEKWNIDPKDYGPWSWEPENVFQRNGSLELRMDQKDHQRNGKQLHYTSGMARIDKPLTYGFFEARIKGCSRYPGACPAFWLYSIGAKNRFKASDGQTIAYSEIDIVELQQCEYDFQSKKHFPVTRIDCNLHTVLIQNGQRVWQRPHNRPKLCKTHFDSTWDPREDYHVYGVKHTKEEIVWYIDGKEVGRKPNLYWHLPMHVTLSLGLRYPFVKYLDDKMTAAGDKTTKVGFPTSMSVDYVRVWKIKGMLAATDWSKEMFIEREKTKWAANGWTWNQQKGESIFSKIDTNNDGVASGQERKTWYESLQQPIK